MPIAPWGISSLLTTCLLVAWAVWLCPAGPLRWGVGAVGGVLMLWMLWFFRNPHRVCDWPLACLVAPSDGVVADIEEVEERAWIGEPCIRIGIFMSIFDVHVNRSPVAGTIGHVRYLPGRFLDARHPSSKHENEANTLGIKVDDEAVRGLRILVRQLSGLIARRIVCTHGAGDHLARGEIFGMVRFGSRTELWLPAGRAHHLRVRVGDRVRCGETVLVEIRDQNDERT